MSLDFLTLRFIFALYVQYAQHFIGLTLGCNHANMVSQVNEYSLHVGHF